MVDLGADKAAVVLLGLAAAGWYATGRAASEALAGPNYAPGRRAVGFAIPVLFCVLAAIWTGRPEIAIGVLFATSVASLTLVLGISAIVTPHTAVIVGRRSWMFLLPVALITLLIGFTGGFRWMHAAVLALEGLALALVWNDSPEATIDTVLPTAQPVAAKIGSALGGGVQLLIAVVAAGVAGWIGVTAARGIANNLELPGAGLIASLMLAPALVLPMLGTCSTLAATSRFDEAIGSVVGFVLINLCLILPLAAALWLARPVWHPPAAQWVQLQFSQPKKPPPATAPATTTASTAPSTEPAAPPTTFPYPMGVWRVDTVLLVAAGLMLLPVSLGRWKLERGEGLAMIVAYTLYMVVTTIASR